MKNILFLLFLILNTSFVDADTESNLPKIQDKPGSLFRLSWNDGRVAKLVAEVSKPIHFKVDLSLENNSCSLYTNVSCKLLTSTQTERIMYIWEKNPLQPKRVGKILRKTNFNSKLKFENGYLYTPYFDRVFFITQYSNSLSKALKLKVNSKFRHNDIIECNNFDWLPKSKNKETYIPHWVTQYEKYVTDFKLKNKTSEAINQYFSISRGITLTKINKNQMKIQAIDLFDTRVKIFSHMALGYKTEFSFNVSQFSNHPNKVINKETLSSPTCNVQFNVNLVDIIQNYKSIEKNSIKENFNLQLTKDVIVDQANFNQHYFSKYFIMKQAAY